jgi:hypothetical protein
MTGFIDQAKELYLIFATIGWGMVVVMWVLLYYSGKDE